MRSGVQTNGTSISGCPDVTLAINIDSTGWPSHVVGRREDFDFFGCGIDAGHRTTDSFGGSTTPGIGPDNSLLVAHHSVTGSREATFPGQLEKLDLSGFGVQLPISDVDARQVVCEPNISIEIRLSIVNSYSPVRIGGRSQRPVASVICDVLCLMLYSRIQRNVILCKDGACRHTRGPGTQFKLHGRWPRSTNPR